MAMLSPHKYVLSKESRIGFRVPVRPGRFPVAFWEDGRAAGRQVAKSKHKAALLRSPCALKASGVPRRGGVHGHRKMRAVQVEGHFPIVLRLSLSPGRIRERAQEHRFRAAAPRRNAPRWWPPPGSDGALPQECSGPDATRRSRPYFGGTPAVSHVFFRMMATPSPRRSIRNLRCADPGTSPTGILPRTEAITSLRVDWLSRMLSIVIPLGSCPGESISSRSAEHRQPDPAR